MLLEDNYLILLLLMLKLNKFKLEDSISKFYLVFNIFIS